MTAAGTLDEAIDAAPMRATTVVTLLLCAAVMIVDGVDLAALPIAVPHVARALAIEPAAFAPSLSAVLVGMGIGAIFLGPIGDVRGRRPMILINLAVIGLATLGTAGASSLGAFLGWRLLTGIGLGACLPNVTALTAEITPRRRRASMLTVTACGASIGGVAAGFALPPLIARGGWPLPFVVLGVGTLALTLLLALLLPESPKYYAARRPRHPGYARLTARLGLGDPAAFAAPPPPTAGVPMLTLFAPAHRMATAVFVGLYLVNALSLYMLTSWLPTVLPGAGFGIDQSARLAAMVQLGGLVGGVAISGFLDRGRAAAGLLGGYALVLASLVALGFLPPVTLGWGALLLAIGGGIAGGHLAIMAVGTSFYPAAVLTSAIGFAVAVARVGAVAGPLVGGLLVGAHVSPQLFFLAAAVPVTVCAAVVTLIPRVERRRLSAG